MIEGSGSVHLTNGSGSRRPKTYGSGSGSATLCPYLGPVLYTLEDLLLPVAGLVLCLSLPWPCPPHSGESASPRGRTCPRPLAAARAGCSCRGKITDEWLSKTGSGLSGNVDPDLRLSLFSGPRKIKDFRTRAPGPEFRIRIRIQEDKN
jgi:hypothetical protein